MGKDPSIEDVRAAIAKVMHPAIDRTLMDLGMIRDIVLIRLRRKKISKPAENRS